MIGFKLNPKVVEWLRRAFRNEIGPTRAFLLFYVLAFAMCTTNIVIGPLHIWSAYLNVPSSGLWWETDLTFDLTIIASVAVVVLTGGVVALQLRGFSLRNAFGMDLLSTTFLACVIAMIDYHSSAHHYLRFIATAFLLLYSVIYINGFGGGWRENNDGLLHWSLNGLLYLLPLMMMVVIFPSEPVIAWLSILTLYFGLQQILRSLGDADRATLLRSALVRVNGGSTRHETWNTGSLVANIMREGFDIKAVVELPPEERSDTPDAPTHVAYFTKPR
jgi:hypothetical protein